MAKIATDGLVVGRTGLSVDTGVGNLVLELPGVEITFESTGDGGGPSTSSTESNADLHQVGPNKETSRLWGRA